MSAAQGSWPEGRSKGSSNTQIQSQIPFIGLYWWLNLIALVQAVKLMWTQLSCQQWRNNEMNNLFLPRKEKKKSHEKLVNNSFYISWFCTSADFYSSVFALEFFPTFNLLPVWLFQSKHTLEIVSCCPWIW